MIDPMMGGNPTTCIMVRHNDHPSAARSQLLRHRYRPTWQDPSRQATLSLPREGLCGSHLPAGVCLYRSISRGEATDCRYGHERQRYSRHCPRLAHQSEHGPNGIKKKATAPEQVNHSVLQVLKPEHVEVEICRSEELDYRRGLTSELDEMWSYVRSKANPRWLWHAMDHHSGQVLAYVFGRPQDTVFLQLQALLKPFG